MQLCLPWTYEDNNVRSITGRGGKPPAETVFAMQKVIKNKGGWSMPVEYSQCTSTIESAVYRTVRTVL